MNQVHALTPHISKIHEKMHPFCVVYTIIVPNIFSIYFLSLHFVLQVLIISFYFISCLRNWIIGCKLRNKRKNIRIFVYVENLLGTFVFILVI